MKAEVLLGAAVGESANSKYIIYIYICIWDDVKWPPNGWLLDFGLLLWVYHFTAVSLKIKFQTSDWYVYMPMRSKSTNMYMHTSACAFTRHNIYIYKFRMSMQQLCRNFSIFFRGGVFWWQLVPQLPCVLGFLGWKTHQAEYQGGSCVPSLTCSAVSTTAAGARKAFYHFQVPQRPGKRTN